MVWGLGCPTKRHIYPLPQSRDTNDKYNETASLVVDGFAESVIDDDHHGPNCRKRKAFFLSSTIERELKKPAKFSFVG